MQGRSHSTNRIHAGTPVKPVRQKNKQLRTRRGASIILVALCAIGLVILVYLSFHLALIMGGSREVRNAVDAAVLNVGKRVPQLKVPANIFADCADSAGFIGMSNISRVWGKAYLINANVEGMRYEGLLTGSASDAADKVYSAAQQVNDNLRAQLTNKSLLDQFFNQLSSNKPAKLLGESATVQTQADNKIGWATAMVDRGAESNLTVSQSQLPTGVHAKIVDLGNQQYMQGYTPIRTNGREFVFPSFKHGEMPHLISDSTFQRNTSGIATNPIPNAFREMGSADGQGTTLSASACAQANPRTQYQLAIPHAFVTITFSNRALWIVEGKQVKESFYGFEPETQQGVKKQPLSVGGMLDGFANLGNEYKLGSLWQLFTKCPGDHTAALNKLVQRVKEIDHNFTTQKLTALMSNQMLMPGASRYIIYPHYTSPDATNPTMKIASIPGSSLPGWLQAANPPEGQSAVIITEEASIDDPNICWDNIIGGKSPTGRHWTEFYGSISWQPGTGMGQCLGDLKLSRTTKCVFTGVP